MEFLACTWQDVRALALCQRPDGLVAGLRASNAESNSGAALTSYTARL